MISVLKIGLTLMKMVCYGNSFMQNLRLCPQSLMSMHMIHKLVSHAGNIVMSFVIHFLFFSGVKVRALYYNW